MATAALRDGDLAAAEAHARGGRDAIRALDMRAYYPHCDAALLQELIWTGNPAAAIPDPQLRQRFLSEVPENVALRGLAGELGAAVDGPLAAPP